MRHVSAHDDLHAVAGKNLVRLFDGRCLTRVERELDQSVQLIGDIVQVRHLSSSMFNTPASWRASWARHWWSPTYS
jgi:predicted thioesterase